MNVQSFVFNNDISVSFNEAGYLNATHIATHFGKVAKDYLKTQRTKEYIAALAQILSDGRKIPTKENQLVKTQKGGIPSEQGTWLHPKLAIDFARRLIRLCADFLLHYHCIWHIVFKGLKSLCKR